MDLRPVDLPRLRDDLIAFTESDVAGQMRLLDMDEERPTPEPIAANMIKGAEGLRGAELFYITPEMCDLAATAAKTLPEFTLSQDDPPARAGFAWFTHPIEDVESGGKPFHAAAVGWMVAEGTVWVTTYIVRDTMPVDWPDGVRLLFPPVVPMGCWPAPIDYRGEALPVEVPVGRTMLATLKTVWLLMRQPLAEVGDATYDRAARRRFHREGKKPPPVRVIALRRPPNSGGHGDGAGREWHHRWIVRGHWRMAAVGTGRQERRPVWISPHVKGPDGAPLLGGEKVYTVAADRTTRSA